MNSTLSQPSAVDEAAMLAELGLSLPRQVLVPVPFPPAAIEEALALPGDRVVVKVSIPRIAHKTEAGAVRIVQRRREAITAAIDDLSFRLGATEVAVVEMIEHDLSPGNELLLAIRWTDEYGPVVTIGLGGTAAEVLASAAVISPALAGETAATLDRKPFVPLLTGFRNQRPRIPREELEALIRRCLSFAASRFPATLTELEINPLVPTARGLYALDLLINRGETGAVTAPARPIAKIAGLLHPRSVAVMGVSANGMNAGRIIARNASEGGNAQVTIVKPEATEIDGIPCVPRLDAIDRVDLLVLSIPAEQVPAAIDEVIAGDRAESIIVIPGGLGERAGSENLERRVRDSLRAARSSPGGGPVVNGANCLGVASSSINTIFLPREKFAGTPGREVSLAVVSQSGALAVSLMTKLAPFTPRYVVSAGNQIDLTVADYLEYLARDPSIGVFAFYVEGFTPLDGRRWMETASRVVRSGRTVILYRAGRTPAGRAATSSHTAAIAGDAVVARELAAAAGVLFAESLDDFCDLVRLSTLLRARPPRGSRLGAMSNAGFESVAFADHLGTMSLAPLSDRTRDAIAEVLGASRLDRIVTIANPLDVNPMLGDEAFARVARLLLDDESVDAAIIGCVPLTGAMRTLPRELDEPGGIVNQLTALWDATTKPWAVSLDSGALYDPMAQALHLRGIPLFRTADRAARLLAAWCASKRLN